MLSHDVEWPCEPKKKSFVVASSFEALLPDCSQRMGRGEGLAWRRRARMSYHVLYSSPSSVQCAIDLTSGFPFLFIRGDVLFGS